MSEKIKKILIYAVANDVIKTYTTIFLNLYLWSEGQSLLNLALFNVAMYISWFIIFPLGVELIHKKGVKFVYKMSASFNVILFSVILFMPKENLYLWIFIVGICNGLARGIYSSAKNTAISIMGKSGEITKYYQFEVLYTRIAQIVTPLIFGVIIYYGNYTISFVIMVVYSIFLYFLTDKIEDIGDHSQTPNVLKNVFEPLKRGNEKVKLLPYSYILGGTYPEFQTLFLAAFTFTITENQIGVALLNVTYSIIIMLLIKLTNRYGKVSGYKWLYIGASLGFIGMGMIFFDDKMLLILANILIVSGTFFYSTTYYSEQLQLVRHMSDEDKMKMVIIREEMLVFARMLVLSLTIVSIVVLKADMMVQMLIIGMFVMATTFIAPMIHKKMNKK